MSQVVDPIGAQLKEVREKLNLTIPQLAPILKIKAATIYKWEEGKSSPRYKNREILVKWLESVHWKEILNTGTPKTGTSTTQETPVSEKGERYLANRTRDPHDYKDKYIAALEARLKDMEFLQRIVDVSLNAIQDDQEAMLSFFKLSLQLEMLKNAGADEKKRKALETQIAQLLKPSKKSTRK